MSREKQIEEMASDLENHTCMSQYQAEIASRMLYVKGYRKASEVAREIVEDAKETLLDYHLQENKKYLKSLSKTKKQFDIETARYRAITYAVKFAISTLDELKKKYTESEDAE